jgi:hypothetical protein
VIVANSEKAAEVPRRQREDNGKRVSLVQGLDPYHRLPDKTQLSTLGMDALATAGCPPNP